MLNNYSIKSVLISISALLTLGALLFSFSLWHAFQSIDDALTEASRQQATVDALNQARFHIVQIQQFLTDVGATHDDDGFANAKENLAAAHASLDQAMQTAPGLSGELNVLKQQITDMHEAGVKMGWDYINLGNEAGTATMKATGSGLDDTAERLTKHLDQFAAEINEKLLRARQHLSSTLTRYSVSRVAFSLILLIVVIVSLLLIYSKIAPPLTALNKSLSAMKQGGGDLSRRIPHETRDEVGEIVGLFNDFLSQLHALMRKVATEVDQLVSTANRLQMMSQRAQKDVQKQQLGTDQVATTVTELSATVAEVSNNTSSAAQNAEQSCAAANNGKSVVTNTVQAIHSLSNNIDRASSVIAKVEHDCVNVSSVLDVIQSIADQTNLLALNAAIEAARAGEQGRGFAVVADEVRTLASRTQDSTHEIQSMIERLQNGSREAVKAMNDSQNQTKETVTVIENTGTLLENISTMAERISQMNSHISDAVREQKIVVEHINQNVIAINEVAASSAADAEQTAQESLHLQQIANNLHTAIAQFKL